MEQIKEDDPRIISTNPMPKIAEDKAEVQPASPETAHAPSPPSPQIVYVPQPYPAKQEPAQLGSNNNTTTTNPMPWGLIGVISVVGLIVLGVVAVSIGRK